jgi:hypothetical protein
MKIIETYSHLNGLEYLLVHKSNLWQEIGSGLPPKKWTGD